MAKSEYLEVTSGALGARNLGLDEPFASPPMKGNRCTLYISKGERRIVTGYRADYAAKKYLDILMGDMTYYKTKDLMGRENTIVLENGLRIRSDEIDRLLAHKYSKKEEKWSLGEPDTTEAIRFRDSVNRVVTEDEEPTSRTTKEPKAKREPREPRPSRDGLISIGDIASELKIEPREARGILRQKKIEKPAAGWCWDKSEVDRIKKLLQNA